MRALVDSLSSVVSGLVMVNLVDFDMLYGHRNDVAGYARALVQFDMDLAPLLAALAPGDALFITADHGCDPTTPSTDHSREYVPLLCYGSRLRRGVDLGVRSSFADLGATVAEMLSVGPLDAGQSFMSLLLDD
jgi:phosphopentomutase